VAKNDVNIPRLASAMTKARLSLRRFRENRREMVRQYVGYHWSEYGADKRVPFNLIAAYCRIVGRHLIAKSPQVRLSTFERSAKPIVSAMETWVNAEINRMRLAQTLQRIVLDAMFSIGIGKVALASPSDSSIAGWQTPAGQPFIERVDLDDFVFDVHARSFEEVGYIGHRYRAPLDVIREDKSLSPKRKKLEPSPHNQFNAEGDERIDVMGKGWYSNEEEFEDFVDLWEIYLPRRRTLLTLAADYGSGGPTGEILPLKEVEWIGPEKGPYQTLCLGGEVPGNPIGKGTIQDLFDLHLAQNELLRKIMRQSARQKEVWAFAVGNEADARKIAEANDGDLVGVTNPDLVKPIISGSVAQQSIAVQEIFKQLNSWLAGNLDSIGGLEPQAKTATQDKMLSEAASATIADMQDRTLLFTGDIVERACWFWHHHPLKEMKTFWNPSGLEEYAIPRLVTPAQRQTLRWDDLAIKVNPYSLQSQTPQMQLSAINTIVTQLVIPLLPLAQQQGVYLDLNKLLSVIAKYGNLPDLMDILHVQEPITQEQEPAGPTAGSAPGPNGGEYIRRSLGGDTNKARMASIVNGAMAGGPAGGSPQAQQFAQGAA